jgi:hypothetical protein
MLLHRRKCQKGLDWIPRSMKRLEPGEGFTITTIIIVGSTASSFLLFHFFIFYFLFVFSHLDLK